MLIPILIFAFLLILLIFFLFKSAETWTWIPITFVALIFLTAIFGGINASRSLKMRQAWKARYMENEEILARVQEETDEALFGPADTVSGYGEGSLRDIALKLRLAQIGKGRVWLDGSPRRNNEQFEITFSAAAPENQNPDSFQPPTMPATEQISTDMQLYAFEASDRVQHPDGDLPPAAYFVGSFKVVAVDQGANQITVEPIFVTKYYQTGSLMRQLAAELATGENIDKINRLYIELDIELANELNTEFNDLWQTSQDSGNSASLVAWLDGKSADYEPRRDWAFFETMPGDSRTAFIDHAGLEPWSDDNPATPEKLANLRQLLTTVYLPAEQLGMDPASASYEFLIDEYNFDGAKVNEINQYINETASQRVNDQFFDPRTEIAPLTDSEYLTVKVLFNEASEEFRVDGTGNNLRVDGAFGQNGEANDPDLKIGRDVVFPKDTEIVISKDQAEKGLEGPNQERGPSVLSRNDADSLEVVYYNRPLRDYPYQLNVYRDLTRQATDSRRAIETDIAVTNRILGDTQQQVDARELNKKNVASDVKLMEAAKFEVDRLVRVRGAELAALKEEIRTTYNQIIEVYRQSKPDADFLDTSIDKDSSSVAGSSK